MNKIKLLWINIKARFNVIYIPNFRMFLNLQEFAWKSLIGKCAIIDSRIVESNGGFKYQQMEISKLPVSKTHSY